MREWGENNRIVCIAGRQVIIGWTAACIPHMIACGAMYLGVEREGVGE